ncbi:hypothetical protein LINPERHAP2_LOCUS16986 [Linum perenne]
MQASVVLCHDWIRRRQSLSSIISQTQATSTAWKALLFKSFGIVSGSSWWNTPTGREIMLLITLLA